MGAIVERDAQRLIEALLVIVSGSLDPDREKLERDLIEISAAI